jgi:hypothetical protein
MFDAYDFDRMNETDIREAIVAPVLRELGYRHSSANDIITELSLRYPSQFIGRKKTSDPVLRGKADYVLEVDRRLRWVVEVKAPGEAIDEDVRDQAYSYAVHAEVQGIYYVITNGRNWEVHRTLDGAGKAPILAFRHEELSSKLQGLANVVAPDSLKRDYREFILDVGKPLAPGLRSFAKILNGTLTYTSCSPRLPGPSIVGLVQHVREGTIERSGNQICAYLKISTGRRDLDDFNRALGLEVFDLTSNASVASTDPTDPTVFSRSLNWSMPKGSRMPSPFGGPTISIPSDVKVDSITTASGVLNGTQFSGVFTVELQMSLLPGVTVRTSGEFQVILS